MRQNRFVQWCLSFILNMVDLPRVESIYQVLKWLPIIMIASHISDIFPLLLWLIIILYTYILSLKTRGHLGSYWAVRTNGAFFFIIMGYNLVVRWNAIVIIKAVGYRCVTCILRLCHILMIQHFMVVNRIYMTKSR